MPPPAPAAEVVDVNAEQTPKKVKVIDPAKEQIKRENIARAAKQIARKKEGLQCLRPIVQRLFTTHPILSATIEIVGVACLRPLMLRVNKELFAWLRAQPESTGYPNIVLIELVGAALNKHVQKRAYLEGIVRLPRRYDLDGNVVSDILDKHRLHAQTRLAHKTKDRHK